MGEQYQWSVASVLVFHVCMHKYTYELSPTRLWLGTYLTINVKCNSVAYFTKWVLENAHVVANVIRVQVLQTQHEFKNTYLKHRKNVTFVVSRWFI